jgi:Ca2+-binding EF-hand superfamily protein
MYQPPTPPYAQSSPYQMYNPSYNTQLPPPPMYVGSQQQPPPHHQYPTTPPYTSPHTSPYQSYTGDPYYQSSTAPMQSGKLYQPPQPTPHPSMNPATNTTPTSIGTEDNTIIWKYFSGVDADQNGLIDYIELRNALSQGGYMFDEEVTRRLIRMFDKNQNNKIDFNEFADLHAYLASMKNAFYTNDINKNGVLDYFEVERCLARAGYQFDRSTLWKIFAIYDTYQQGSLHFDAYMKMCIFLGNVKNTFQMNDKTNSGQVTFSFQTYLQNCLNFA